MTKKSKKPKSTKDDEKAKKKAAKQQRAAAKKADAKTVKKAAAKQSPKQSRKAPEAAPAQPPAQTGVDEVHVLRLALRDTEAKLVEAEASLRRVSQELADERRAAADAVTEQLEDAVVEAAVAETVAEAVADAQVLTDEFVVQDSDVVLAEVVAETLDDAAASAVVADDEADHSGEAEQAAAAFQQDGAAVTPPEPVATAERADDEPNESWTLFRLRAEARTRHLAGYSTLAKADLLARLRA